MTHKKIAIIGECMIELSEKGESIKRGFGGDTLNTAIYLARQADETQLSVDYVTALGIDSFSDQMIAAWQQEKVGTRLIQRLENKMPGLYALKPMIKASAPFGTGAATPPRATGWTRRSPPLSSTSWRATTTST